MNTESGKRKRREGLKRRKKTGINEREKEEKGQKV
jgi:hypothetical protein